MDWQDKLWQQGFERLVPQTRSSCGHREVGPFRALALTGIVLGSVGGGALLGAAFMALVAPTSGRVLRRKLARVLTTSPTDEPEVADYDSGEYVLDELAEAAPETAPHHRSDYPSIAQPTTDDDARIIDDGNEAPE